MGENHERHKTTSSRFGLKHAGAGEIVEVQGGHIVRSTGRKDRHSKVCTAKGPRDRRVRLSAHTAIQFYDVQDRLGYDRPSKAVDWLIKKAKSAIDELAELPAWNPTSGSTANADFQQNPAQNQHEEQNSNQNHQEEQNLSQNHQIGSLHGLGDAIAGSSSVSRCDVQNNTGEFLQQALDSDAIADTIKSFFPMGGATSAAQETNSPAMHFQNFASPPDLLSRAQSQDLRLSLQSFQDPMLLHQHQPPQHHQTEPALFPGTAALGFDAPSGGWSDHQRMVAWNAAGDSGTGGGAFVFSSPATTPFLQPLFGQNQFLSQRGPLQSSYTQPIRAWIDPSTVAAATTAADHHHQSLPFHASSLPSINFAASFSGFPGFHIPARIQGEQEEHDGISDKPSSASSDSRH
ncbi:hypothetical protein NMG60_11003371 [Bertholletia excelsa]